MTASTSVAGDGGPRTAAGTTDGAVAGADAPAGPTRRPRRPRDQVVSAILDAADALFSERSPSAVSLREIAEAAGVQHSLIHRHFGTKDDLLRAVVDRASRRFRDELVGDDPVEVALAAYRSMFDHPTLIRVMLRCVLDGEDPRRYMTSSYAFNRLADLAGPVGSDGASVADEDWPASAPPMGVAVLGVFSIGAVVAEPWLRAADGMQDVTSAQWRAAMERTITAIVEQAVVPPDEP